MNNVAQCLARAAHPQRALYLPSTATAAAAENGGLKSEELGPTRAVRHLMDATAGRGGTIESVHRLCRRTQSGSVNIWTKRSHGRLKAPVVHAHVFETSLKARCKRVESHQQWHGGIQRTCKYGVGPELCAGSGLAAAEWSRNERYRGFVPKCGVRREAGSAW